MSAFSTGDVIEKLSYTHDALVDLLIENPAATQREIARYFGYTEGWVSQIIRCDVIREKLAERSKELLDPTILMGIERRFEALAHRSVDILMDQLDVRGNLEVALKALEITSRSLGYGAKAPGVQINQQFVVAMPLKEANSGEWAEKHKPQSLFMVGALPVITVDTMIDG
jgi:hypothetical protein